jgi:hypothetical protein
MGVVRSHCLRRPAEGRDAGEMTLLRHWQRSLSTVHQCPSAHQCLSQGSNGLLSVESGRLGDLGPTGTSRYRRSVPVTTMSTVRLPHRAQTSR